MRKKDTMKIIICTHEEDASLVLENVMAYFSQEFPETELVWKRSKTTLTTSLQTDDQEITRIFEALVHRYPELQVEASYSYDVREDDNSAQWWGTTKIYSQREAGEPKIVSSSNTYWN